MSVFDFFRNVFGFRDRPNKFNIPTDGETGQFHNPLWNKENTDDDTDDDIRVSINGLDLFSSPFEEMQRYFEQQVFEMIKQMQTLEDPSVFGDIGLTEVPVPLLPHARSPRDEVLKPGYETIDGLEQKVDLDLDEHVSKYGLSSLLRGNFEPKLDVAVPTRIVGQSVTRKVVKRPDGSVEREEVVRDNTGNEQRTVTHTIGNQSHSVITTTGPDGVQTTETLENIDQDKLGDFMKKWESGKNQKPVERSKLGIIPEDFPFNKFFK